ncbi:MAG: GTPase Era [Bacteroidales bacterium]|nr:GTPase Era [Bacteroidales bacterium]
MGHKAGFVNIIGNPNVGKSTLMNALVGDKLSIITSKAQTTRHRILGIVNGKDYQIVYSDTPGILKPKYKLQEKMLKSVTGALSDADVLLYVTDYLDDPLKNIDFVEKLKLIDTPLILLVNKIDIKTDSGLKETVEKWMSIFEDVQIIPISALKKTNLDAVLSEIIKLLPESPPYFPDDQLTDKTERFLVSEIIREKIIMFYKQEIPYAVEVEVESFIDKKDIIHISAKIYVGRDTQKGIIIGKGGLSLKRVGTEARKDIEAFFGKKVFLELFVKVRKDWKDNERYLKQWGYN